MIDLPLAFFFLSPRGKTKKKAKKAKPPFGDAGTEQKVGCSVAPVVCVRLISPSCLWVQFHRHSNSCDGSEGKKHHSLPTKSGSGGANYAVQ